MIKGRIISVAELSRNLRRKLADWFRLAIGSTTPQTDEHVKLLEGQPKHMDLVVEGSKVLRSYITKEQLPVSCRTCE